MMSHGRLLLAAGILRTGWDPAAAVYNPEAKIESARLYGNIREFAYYFVDVLVGLPQPQRVSVIVDTGSSLLGFPCKPCDHCGHHMDPLYDIDASVTARRMPCTPACKCRGDWCGYTQSYVEGSSISGFWFKDEVRLGDAPQSNPPVNVTIGCHTNERKLFYSQRANGIMGLARTSSVGHPTILEELFRDSLHVNTGVFAICLSERGGRLTVGGANQTYQTSAIAWIQLGNSQFYVIQPVGLAFGGVTIADSQSQFGTALVDSGTTFTYFPTALYVRVAAAIVAACSTAPGCGAHRHGKDCWMIDNIERGPVLFPPITFVFAGGIIVNWAPQAYLFPSDSPRGLWCHAFQDNGADQSTVLGISWMLYKDVIFDLNNRVLGVAEANCPNTAE